MFSTFNSFIDYRDRWRIDPDMVSEKVHDFSYRIWLITAKVSPNDIDDVGPSVESGIDDSGAVVCSLRAVVEFGDDEALVGIVILLVLCVGRWLDKGYVRMWSDKGFLSHELHIQCRIQEV